MTRLLITHVLAFYLGAGLFAGLLTQRAVPALNSVGVAFIAVTWPEQIRFARISSGCSLPIDRVPEQVQSWMFSLGTEEGF